MKPLREGTRCFKEAITGWNKIPYEELSSKFLIEQLKEAIIYGATFEWKTKRRKHTTSNH